MATNEYGDRHFHNDVEFHGNVVGATGLEGAGFESTLINGDNADGAYSIVIGHGSRCYDSDGVVVGRGILGNSKAVAVGNGAAVTDRAVAVGFGASAADGALCYGVAVGYTAIANYRSASVGYNANSSKYGVAVGARVNATGLYGAAVGYGSRAFTYAVAMGLYAYGNAVNSVALGRGATVSVDHDRSVALGYNALSAGVDTVTLGRDISPLTLHTYGPIVMNGQRITGVGAPVDDTDAATKAYADGLTVVLPDPYTPPDGTWNIIGGISVSGGALGSEQFGKDAIAGSNYSTVLGGGAKALASDTSGSVVVGHNAESLALGAIVLGQSSKGRGERAVSIGSSSDANADDSISIGTNAQCHLDGVASVGIGSTVIIGDYSDVADYSVAIGYYSIVYGSNNVAVGRRSLINHGSRECVAIGAYAKVDDDRSGSVALGKSSLAWADSCVAVGDGAGCFADSGTAVGPHARAYYRGSGFGRNATADADECVAIGYFAYVPTAGTNGISVGRGSSTQAVDGVAVGNQAYVHPGHTNGIAIGRNASTQSANSGEWGSTTEPVNFRTHAGIAAFGVTPPTAQPVHIADPTGGTTVDSESRSAINAILQVLEGAGLVASS